MGFEKTEQKWIKYINAQLEEPLSDESLEFRTWKSCVDIRDIDLYHRVAQCLQENKLNRGITGIFYQMSVPEYEGCPCGDTWTVCLVGRQDEDFLEKYGKHYEVTEI
jgi:hypothetical protein